MACIPYVSSSGVPSEDGKGGHPICVYWNNGGYGTLDDALTLIHHMQDSHFGSSCHLCGEASCGYLFTSAPSQDISMGSLRVDGQVASCCLEFTKGENGKGDSGCVCEKGYEVNR